MTTRQETTTGKAGVKKLKLKKKETIKDLDLKNNARDVKGGWWDTKANTKL